MRLTGGELVVRALEDEGIRFAFGIPGTHNIELYDALGDSDQVRPILITNEQSAGFMADGLWRASGEMGCVNIVPGAGLTHALSGVAEAFMDCVPMLVLGCGIRRHNPHAYQLHDVDQLAIAAPIVKATFRPEAGADLYRVIREACALARGGTPGPVMVEVSVDHYLTRHTVDPDGFRAPDAVPAPGGSAEEIRAAAELLSDPGAKPFIYAGLGAQGATAELLALAERLEAPVSTTFQGKGVFPESHPLFLWNGFGTAAPAFVRAVADERNVTLAVGCRFSEVGTGSYGFTPPGPLIHVDINAEVLNRNFPAALGIVSDARRFLTAALQELEQDGRPGEPVDTRMRTRIREGHDAVRKDWIEHRSAGRVTPFVLLDALQRELGPDTIFVADSGNGTFLAMECLRLDRPGRFLAPVDYSCMGYSMPASIGAALGKPGAPVVALAGDGAFLMTGLELLTAVSQRVPVAVFVLRDRELAQIAQFQSTAFNRRVASALPDYHAGSLAEAVGAEWLSLDSDAGVTEVVRAVRATMQAGRPVLVDVAIDYSGKTHFTRGVVKTMLGRLSWPDRIRFVARALSRRIKGG
jgi:acetolactate synthase I/II/III large subunit